MTTDQESNDSGMLAELIEEENDAEEKDREETEIEQKRERRHGSEQPRQLSNQSKPKKASSI